MRLWKRVEDTEDLDEADKVIPERGNLAQIGKMQSMVSQYWPWGKVTGRGNLCGKRRCIEKGKGPLKKLAMKERKTWEEN